MCVCAVAQGGSEGFSGRASRQGAVLAALAVDLYDQVRGSSTGLADCTLTVTSGSLTLLDHHFTAGV